MSKECYKNLLHLKLDLKHLYFYPAIQVQCAATQELWGGSPVMDGLTSARNFMVLMDVMQWLTVWMNPDTKYL